MKKILFISHDASRTGAPRSLLRLMRWLKDNTTILFLALLKESGPLQGEFESISPILNFNIESSKNEFLSKVVNKLSISMFSKEKYYLKSLQKKLIQENIDLIYTNTIANGEVLEFLVNFLDCPIVCHVHELELGIRNYTKSKHFEIVKRHTQKYIAVSEAVKVNLIKNHNIPERRIEVIYNGISLSFFDSNNDLQCKNQIKEQLKIPNTAKVICASGVIEYRKGPDLFIQLARTILQQNHQFLIYFIWLGSGRKGTYFDHLLHDINTLELQEYVRFLGVKTNPLDYFAACDVFALLSREDPFPLVVLEAASVGKPILCFDKSGGAKEFIEDDCGFVVPYLDIEAMAEKVLTLLNNPELFYNLGQRAKQKVQERHDINITAPKIVDLIEKMLC